MVGGTFDPQAQAAELGLIEPYKSKHIDAREEQLHELEKKKEEELEKNCFSDSIGST